MSTALYYTDNRLDGRIAYACWEQLQVAGGGRPIVRVTPGAARPGVLTMHRQILMGLEQCDPGVVFLCEHDVLYHPSHFEFVPPEDDTFYYNTNVWKARWPDGHAVWTDDLQQVSGLCADRDLLLDYYTARVEQLEREGPNRHYEPGLKQTVGGQKVANWRSEWPNVDIRHGGNLTKSKWSPAEFRNPRYARGWREADEVPGWGRVGVWFLEPA